MKLEVKQELFNQIGIELDQLHWNIDKSNDFQLCGSMKYSGTALNADGYELRMKANFCDASGGILHIARDFRPYKSDDFSVINYVVFDISSANVSRFFKKEELDHIELYPEIRKEV